MREEIGGIIFVCSPKTITYTMLTLPIVIIIVVIVIVISVIIIIDIKIMLRIIVKWVKCANIFKIPKEYFWQILTFIIE